MADKDSAAYSIIQEMYQLAAELTISSDKATQSRGKELRKLIEQIESQLAQNTTPNR
ncbi:MAG: hypothetical protein P4N59_16825 [Negativicutes bacterium]|nr:hypothetical protein [Negativicutes bacterium]